MWCLNKILKFFFNPVFFRQFAKTLILRTTFCLEAKMHNKNEFPIENWWTKSLRKRTHKIRKTNSLLQSWFFISFFHFVANFGIPLDDFNGLENPGQTFHSKFPSKRGSQARKLSKEAERGETQARRPSQVTKPGDQARRPSQARKPGDQAQSRLAQSRSPRHIPKFLFFYFFLDSGFDWTGKQVIWKGKQLVWKGNELMWKGDRPSQSQTKPGQDSKLQNSIFLFFLGSYNRETEKNRKKDKKNFYFSIFFWSLGWKPSDLERKAIDFERKSID